MTQRAALISTHHMGIRRDVPDVCWQFGKQTKERKTADRCRFMWCFTAVPFYCRKKTHSAGTEAASALRQPQANSQSLRWFFLPRPPPHAGRASTIGEPTRSCNLKLNNWWSWHLLKRPNHSANWFETPSFSALKVVFVFMTGSRLWWRQENLNFDEKFQTVALRQIEGRRMRIRLTKKQEKKETRVSEIKVLQPLSSLV